MDDTTSRHGIFGVGYEGQSIDAFIYGLRASGTLILADVRLNAISRKRGFSKRLLEASLAEAGIGYWHVPELGIRAGTGPGLVARRRKCMLRGPGSPG